MQADALRDLPGHYKIKLKASATAGSIVSRMSEWSWWWFRWAIANEARSINRPRSAKKDTRLSWSVESSIASRQSPIPRHGLLSVFG